MSDTKSTVFLQLIVALLLFAIVVMMLLVFFPQMKSEVAAAWVQAFGAIVGLALAVLIMHLQGGSAKRAESLLLGRRLDALAALVERADAQVDKMRVHITGVRNWSAYFFAVINVDEMEAIGQALKMIPLHELPSYEIVVGVQEMILALDKLRPVAVRHNEANNVHAVFVGSDLATVTHRARKMTKAKEMILESIRSLGHELPPTRVALIR